MSACIGIALLVTGIAAAQNAVPVPETPMSVPTGYSAHSSVDVGGRIAGISGSGAMYDTLVNLQSGPRVQGQTFELHALPGNKHTFVDDMRVFTTGFGGDPNNVAKMDFSKGKYYEFSGLFRRDRQYFDYDLLGNANVPSGLSMPIGPSASPTGSLAYPQLLHSPFLFNTVRRMTDTNLTILPVSRVTFRFGYSQNIMQGPTNTPSGYQLGGSYSLVLQEYQRNSTDDFTGAVDWKPLRNTKLTYEEQIDHYKGGDTFSLDPANFIVQEADGTKAALLITYDSLNPYTSSSCISTSMGGNPMLTASPTGAPIINAACAVALSYQRSQPTRILYPTEIFRLQSSSIKNISMNGDARYTSANMNLPAYLDSFEGLSGVTHSSTYTGIASAQRKVMAADYGIVWQASKTVSIEDQVNFSNVQQPGSSTMTSVTTVATAKDSSTSTGNETINNPTLTTTVVNTATTPATATFEGSSSVGVPLPAFFGQKLITNNATVSWDATPRSVFALTYRYQDHIIAESQSGASQNIPIPANNTTSGMVTIHENGGIFTVALRPSANWDVNGSAEVMYNDNAFTPMGFRQLRHYRVHTLFRPKTWATVSGAFNDLERHNNTNNNQNFPGNTVVYAGPLDHVDHSRVGSLGAQLFPNSHYGIDFNYSFSDVYMSDNICYLGSASASLPAASTPSGAACPGAATRSGIYDFGPAKDFMDAPTQDGSFAFMLAPSKTVHSDLGYRVSAVNGSRFFNDAREVNGSLASTYQSPFVNFSWESHPGLVWKAEYNFFGYGEGGSSGAEYCSTTNPTPAVPATPVGCSGFAGIPGTGGQTGMTISSAGETAARNFHANNVTLGFHYEF